MRAGAVTPWSRGPPVRENFGNFAITLIAIPPSLPHSWPLSYSRCLAIASSSPVLAHFSAAPVTYPTPYLFPHTHRTSRLPPMYTRNAVSSTSSPNAQCVLHKCSVMCSISRCPMSFRRTMRYTNNLPPSAHANMRI